MPFQVDIQTNIQDKEMTIESCSEIIAMLQSSYKSIRSDIYISFFSTKNLSKSLMVAGVFALLYVLSKELFFIYMMPISVFVSMLLGFIGAQALSSQIKKQIDQQIVHFKQLRDKLINDQKIKA